MARSRALTLGLALALLVVVAPGVGYPCDPSPCAQADADVIEGPAPLTVNLTGANSLPAAGGSYAWDLGDGTPYRPNVTAQATYTAPGGYTAVLTVSYGGQDYTSSVFISVTTTDGIYPPRIDWAQAVPPLEGTAGLLSVQFNATAVDPAGGQPQKRWRIGNGEVRDWAIGNYAYDNPGRYMARFEVIGGSGLRSLSQPFVITAKDGTSFPPLVRATADKTAGAPPLLATLSATMTPSGGSVWQWILDDARTGSTADFEILYELPGSHWVQLVGTDASSRKGYDEVLLRVTEGVWGAAVVTVPPTRACVGVPYPYTAETRGTPPVSFSLIAAPTGMTVDADGVFSWTPTVDQVGSQAVALKAENATGSDEQRFDIEVSCCTDGVCPEETESSGCAYARSGAGAAGLLALVLAGVLLRARRRR